MEQEMNLIERTYASIRRNIERLEEGGVNCIEFAFPRSRKYFPGIERAAQYGILAQTKIGKTQFGSEEFIYRPLMELYYGKKTFNYTVIYINAEETPERIVQRFMAWLLYEETDGKINVSPAQIRSTSEPCPQEALDMLDDEHIRDILEFFCEHVIFPEESLNPTGIRNWCIKYAEKHGTTYYRDVTIEDEFGTQVTKQVFDHYVPDDPEAFVILFIDPINRLNIERGMDERQNIKKMSEYCAKELRNNYFFTPVIIQQANFDSFSLDAAKTQRFEPNVGNSGGSKEITQDFDAQLALYCPYNYDVQTYYGYDISVLRKHGLFARLTINRNAEAGSITPMFFDGTTSHFWELPKPKDAGGMQAVYNYCEQLAIPHTAEELAALNPFIKRHTPKADKPENVSLFNLLFNPDKWR